MPGKHSAKQKRQARHIKEGYERRGRSGEDAERIAWATVNKNKKLRKDYGAGNFQLTLGGKASGYTGAKAPAKPAAPVAPAAPKGPKFPSKVAQDDTGEARPSSRYAAGRFAAPEIDTTKGFVPTRAVKKLKKKDETDKGFHHAQLVSNATRARHGAVNDYGSDEDDTSDEPSQPSMPKPKQVASGTPAPKTAVGQPKPKPKVFHSIVRSRSVNDNKEKNMSKSEEKEVDFDDLFKSEIAEADEQPLFDCPHCEHPVTKSEVLAKARKKSKLVNDNKGGGISKPGSGKPGKHNSKTPTRSVHGAKKHDGGLPGPGRARKSDAESEDEVDKSEEQDETETTETQNAQPPQEVRKGSPQQPIVRGTPHVFWVDDGEDQRIADAIAKGELGGSGNGTPQHPIDRNARAR